MITILDLIFILIGILSLFVFPKILKWILIVWIIYMTIFVDIYFSALIIPLLLIMGYYKRRGGRY